MVGTCKTTIRDNRDEEYFRTIITSNRNAKLRSISVVLGGRHDSSRKVKPKSIVLVPGSSVGPNLLGLGFTWAKLKKKKLKIL